MHNSKRAVLVILHVCLIPETQLSDGSGILLAAKILSDKFNISVGAAGLDNFINIRTGFIDAIFNLLKTDSRFTVVSAPRLRVKNNASASFSVGSDVPVLGSVTVNNNTTTQFQRRFV